MSFPRTERKIPTGLCCVVSGVITAWSLRLKNTLHQRCSACPYVSLRKRATFRPGVHVREGESGTNPCTSALKERSDTGVSDESWVSGSLDAREAESGSDERDQRVQCLPLHCCTHTHTDVEPRATRAQR
ncbi:hypothetical protein PO909_008860 [Leuciscus waleckii]